MTRHDFRIVGTSVKRTDVLEKVTGEGRYTGDYALPGMLHGKIKRADVAHARIVRIDASRALAYPGVKAVLTHADVPRVLHYGSPHPRSASCTRDQYILDDRARFWGEGVAAVAATSEEIADEALDLIQVEYEPLPAVLDVDDFTPSYVAERARLIDLDGEHGHGHGHQHSHDATVRSSSFAFDRPFSFDRLQSFLKRHLSAHGPSAFRTKGILWIAGDERFHALQAVHELIDLRPDHAWQDEQRQSRIVFIGRGFDRAALEADLRGCLAETAA